MSHGILLIAVVFAFIDWYSIVKNRKKLEYYFKPAVIVVMTIWLVQNGALSGWMIWFVFGAAFSLAGDIFLLFPQKYFLYGLVSFFLAHVCYIIGINRTYPSLTVVSVILVIPFIILVWWIFRRLVAGLNEKGLSNLKLPVLLYLIIITVMTISAILTNFREDWTMVSALLISGGAILFLFSDSILAWDRFVTPISHSRLKTMVTYYLGQAGILIGATTHFLQ